MPRLPMSAMEAIAVLHAAREPGRPEDVAVPAAVSKGTLSLPKSENRYSVFQVNPGSQLSLYS